MAVYSTEEEANKPTITIMAMYERFGMMKPFIPKLVYFEPKALDYPLGREL